MERLLPEPFLATYSPSATGAGGGALLEAQNAARTIVTVMNGNNKNKTNLPRRKPLAKSAAALRLEILVRKLNY